MAELITISEAKLWASQYLKKNVTHSNISYLVSYGLLKKFGENGAIMIDKRELKKYYDKNIKSKEEAWKDALGQDLNWKLSFSQYKESETTKHVNRLHPYKGKFIPQLVEYFLDQNVDEFKTEVFFHPGDIVLDPFCGSGTTLVQSSELGIHAIGLEISPFNTLISNIKIKKHNLPDLAIAIKDITSQLARFISNNNIQEFDDNLLLELSRFNKKQFPTPDYRYNLKQGIIKEKQYAQEKSNEFLNTYNRLYARFNIENHQNGRNNFLNKWYLPPVRQEIRFVKELLDNINDDDIRNILKVILSRTIRSCRATTHSDLATIKNPITTTYYCTKHYKICKPIFSILKMWKRYSEDTLKRLSSFNQLRTDTYQYCLTGNSKNINIFERLNQENPQLGKLAQNQRIKGIFSSPPYVGLINYHEQHAYAYDLFQEYERNDDLEIGSMTNGSSNRAKDEYVGGISEVLINARNYMVNDFDVFLVANDKFGLYPKIAENAQMQIVTKYKRPVLNRTERTKSAYSEIIFHLKSL